jgi:inner membrane protein
MDPFTHIVLGSSLGYVVFGRRLGRATSVGVGSLAGAAPDLDVLIGSATDPLLAVEYHRHFSHALAFAPVGAGLVIVLLALYRPWRETWSGRFAAVWSCALMAWVSHCLLDAATSYGTQLLWPFTDRRYGWDFISVVDPFFTLALLTGLVVALVRMRPGAASVGLVVAAAYLGGGVRQHYRAVEAQAILAASRGHTPERFEVMPTLGNVLVWRTLYECEGRIYADRIRVGLTGDATVRGGWALTKMVASDRTSAEQVRDQRRSFARFTWFSEGWVARSPSDPSVFGDMRYSLSTEAFDPIWGIRYTPIGAPTEIEWVNRSRDRRVSPSELWTELQGRDPRFTPIRKGAPVAR